MWFKYYQSIVENFHDISNWNGIKYLFYIIDGIVFLKLISDTKHNKMNIRFIVKKKNLTNIIFKFGTIVAYIEVNET